MLHSLIFCWGFEHHIVSTRNFFISSSSGAVPKTHHEVPLTLCNIIVKRPSTNINFFSYDQSHPLSLYSSHSLLLFGSSQLTSIQLQAFLFTACRNLVKYLALSVIAYIVIDVFFCFFRQTNSRCLKLDTLFFFFETISFTSFGHQSLSLAVNAVSLLLLDFAYSVWQCKFSEITNPDMVIACLQAY